ncbi:MAG: hypothetical protein GY772_10780, partial [bacterium]|nr:hypothetical protein [bacterium]
MGLFNFGGARKAGEPIYAQNLAGLPVTVICMLECHETGLWPILAQRVPPPRAGTARQAGGGSGQGAALAASSTDPPDTAAAAARGGEDDAGAALAAPNAAENGAAGAADPTRPEVGGPLWISTGIVDRCAVLAKTTRVERLQVDAKWVSQTTPASRLMKVRIVWRQPVAGKAAHTIVLGHLHNTVAKKACQERADFVA